MWDFNIFPFLLIGTFNTPPLSKGDHNLGDFFQQGGINVVNMFDVVTLQTRSVCASEALTGFVLLKHSRDATDLVCAV